LKLSTCDIAEQHRSKYLLLPVMLTLTENHLHMHVNLELACLRPTGLASIGAVTLVSTFF
jgi:hypothetical protein